MKPYTIARHCVQISVVAFLCLIAAHSANDMELFRSKGKLQDVFAPDETIYSRLAESISIVPRILKHVTGNLWHLKAGPVLISDPLAVLEGTAASHDFNYTLMISAIPLIILTLLLGRVFCSFICPIGLILEISAGIRSLISKAGFNLIVIRIPAWTKYLLLAVGLIMAYVTSGYVLAWIYAPRLFYMALDNYFITGTLRFGFVFICAITLIDLLATRRGWCTAVCPGGALFSLLGAGRLLRLKHSESRCTQCGECREKCPYDLRPDLQTPNMECDNCKACVHACPESALTYRVANQRDSDK
jgi:ferredoxin-type protein NapH